MRVSYILGAIATKSFVLLRKSLKMTCFFVGFWLWGYSEGVCERVGV